MRVNSASCQSTAFQHCLPTALLMLVRTVLAGVGGTLEEEGFFYLVLSYLKPHGTKPWAASLETPDGGYTLHHPHWQIWQITSEFCRPVPPYGRRPSSSPEEISMKFTFINFSAFQQDTTTSSPMRSGFQPCRCGEWTLFQICSFLGCCAPRICYSCSLQFSLPIVVNPLLFILNFPCSITMWLLAPDRTMIQKY